MGNSTTFLTIPAGQKLGTEVCYFEREIDFSVENVANGDSVDVLRVPKGAVPIASVVTTHTANGDASATAALSIAGASLTVDAADTLPAANAGNITYLTTTKVLTADDTLRLTIGTANMVEAKITVGLMYIVSDSRR
jgi:hypothetical protein